MFRVVRLLATATVLVRLSRVVGARPVVAAPARGVVVPTISVVVPARDEGGRLGPLLDAIVGAPGVAEIIVVDDESSDDTAELAVRAGAAVVHGLPRPEGWAGKSWALQQGLEAATAEWVVTLDADTRPRAELPLALVLRADRDRSDLLTVAGRFECPSPAGRWLHAAMLTTFVYRFGPPGCRRRPRPERTIANGQCMVFRRSSLVARDGFAPVADAVVEDVALARHLARQGHRVDFLDAGELLTVRPYGTLGDTWVGWGRSLGLPGVETRLRRLAELVLLVLVLPTPLVRVVAGRADAVDAVLIVARLGTLVGTCRAYRPRGFAYWASMLADGPAVAALAVDVVRRRQEWRGRSYAT